MVKSEAETEEIYIIDAIDYAGQRVVFTEEKWKEKRMQHTELNNGPFLKNLKKAIESPQSVWQDYGKPSTQLCYYWKHKIDCHIKVVINTLGSPWRVVTAYEIDYIKEVKYPNLKQLK